ncbi:MAG: histidine kinase, partial [Clostridia bacterium]|nr:histidine kinase [Clostridia bacterium]
MSSIHLPYINIALDAFGLFVMVIVFLSCINEHIRDKRSTSKPFMLLLIFVIATLISDLLSWIGEGKIELSTLTTVSNTVAVCFSYITIMCFMFYLRETMNKTKLLSAMVWLFGVLSVVTIAFLIANAFYGYSFYVDEFGHYVRVDNIMMSVIYIQFPVLSFIAIILALIFTDTSDKMTKISFITYTIFPVLGVLLDYCIHGLSLTYIGLVLSVLIIYANIYLQKQKMIEKQKNALMLSQINPHFVYNTLSTIAAMCDSAPTQAKHLTIDFAKYLRRNIDTLSMDEKIPFDRELEHVECYLKIEKARFRERLNIIYSIQCKDFSVPPLTIQPLVENAIKHGITKKASGGTIKICTYENDTSYFIEIIDDGVGFDTETAELHVGIKNVRNRIASMCGGELTIKSTV